MCFVYNLKRCRTCTIHNGNYLDCHIEDFIVETNDCMMPTKCLVEKEIEQSKNLTYIVITLICLLFSLTLCLIFVYYKITIVKETQPLMAQSLVNPLFEPEIE